ncbi:DUF6544 family protein [Flavihumibacter fluvii]|uniref:DUF6544 family protein n=1 Tax=Flavihumibacter fluvii TaxID=2838157 RepID=UPI001BDE40DD|nr:DUF6544 family protein [Flavihumibacter fluvii]ULQ54714.1 hypothetical protein KJS93_10330 [Flavihumibacter fluvii]
MKYLFALAIFMHGLIHLMGFAKAFRFGNMAQLTKDISKPAGSFWLLACGLFLTCAVGFLLKKDWWPILAMLAVATSTVVILISWKDARLGMIPNLMILLVAIAAWTTQRFEASFKQDVMDNLQRTNNLAIDLLIENDIRLLPKPVQKYLHYAGALNKPKVKNMRVVFEGEMRSRSKGWFKFQSVQYNFFDEPARLFFMKANMFGTAIPGYHKYQNASATMDVKPFGLFSVVQAKGVEMNKAETVTVFNDMCLMAPASLIDTRIQWEAIDSLTAKAIFTNGSSKIAATLYFSEAGQLVNFISDDRYDISDMKQYRFSTPVKEYKNLDGRNVLQYGLAVWHYPEGEFDYGKFYLKSIAYNVDDFQTW